MVKRKITYAVTKLPVEENVKKFAIAYTPDTFTKEEQLFLTPFFTNLDRPVFALKNLPQEVSAALAARYSRSTKSIRRMFLDEYIGPIVNPEKQKNWEGLTEDEKKEAKMTRKEFRKYIQFYHVNGGIEKVVNVQRGRAFFEKWLAQYGDDSIAELGGVLVCVEGVSNIASNEMQDVRVGLSPLEKSSRYVQFWDKRPDGRYQYVTPGEIHGTKFEKLYTKAMDKLFDTYATLAEPYLEYIKELYPQETDETPGSFKGSRSAKRFDDIRDVLPFATQTSVAMYGNGRAFETLLNRLLDHPIGEIRWWGHGILQELEKVVPSFVKRPATIRGAETQIYRSNINIIRQHINRDVLQGITHKTKPVKWARLASSTPDADVEILTTFLFQASDGTEEQVRKKVKALPAKKRAEYLTNILSERQFGRAETRREADRFRKPPRAFESAKYIFEIWGRGGDYRDLHRHRQLTQHRQRLSTKWGYDLEKEVIKSPFAPEFEEALKGAAQVFEKLESFSPLIAQYAVPYGYLTHWTMEMTAREIYWMIELRTGPQGRPHYREICQQIAHLAMEKDPVVFQGLLVDDNDYSLSRRESEKKIEKKLKEIKK